MADSGIIASVGTTGDSYDNALAETVSGLYKSEVIHYLKDNWTGLTKHGCIAQLVMYHLLSLKSAIMII